MLLIHCEGRVMQEQVLLYKFDKTQAIKKTSSFCLTIASIENIVYYFNSYTSINFI